MVRIRRMLLTARQRADPTVALLGERRAELGQCGARAIRRCVKREHVGREASNSSGVIPRAAAIAHTSLASATVSFGMAIDGVEDRVVDSHIGGDPLEQDWATVRSCRK
jgi:hypothetical protein